MVDARNHPARTRGFLSLVVLGVVALLTVVSCTPAKDAMRLVDMMTGAILPPEFALYVQSPKAEKSIRPITRWKDPSAVTVSGKRILVLDTGNDRILELDEKGQVASILCESGPCAFLLKHPMAMASHDGLLYIANTEKGQVALLTLGGEIVDLIDLPRESSVSPEPRPMGIVVSNSGEFFVSDAAGNRVLRYGATRELLGVLGEGQSGDKYSLSEPRGLALDDQGNLFVADSGNGRVKKFSPSGRHLAEYAMRDNPHFWAPQAIAVGPEGTVYFTSEGRMVVPAYAPEGDWVGIVGLLDASREDSPGVLRKPYGLHMEGKRLYVMDLVGGLYAFDVDGRYWASSLANSGGIAPH